MRSPQRLPLIGVLVLIGAGLVLAGCGAGSAKYSSYGAKYGVTTWLVNAKTPVKDATTGVPGLELTATPGQDLSIDLAGTVLYGKVFRRGKANAWRCIDKAEWTLNRPGVASVKGSKAWPYASNTSNEACKAGAVDRTIQVALPDSLPSGSTLSIVVYSDACANTSLCTSWSQITSSAGRAWTTGTVVIELAAAAPAPTARLVARATPIVVGGLAPTATLWREVDARTSTDPGGGALTYAWDLNGDGQYGSTGDESATPVPVSGDPARTLPTGVAIVPLVNLPEASYPALGELTVGVKVTNTAGQSSTATVKLQTTTLSDPIMEGRVSLSTATPTAGGSLEVTVRKQSDATYTRACLDLDGDGAYEETIPYAYGQPAPITTTARAAGPHVITTAFVVGGGEACADIGTTVTPAMIFRDVYVSQAATARSAQTRQAYGGTARMTLSRSVVVKNPTMDQYTAKGEILAGKFALKTPKTAGGVARPAGLASFVKGDYAQKTDALIFTPISETKTIVTGTGTILLRGTKGALLCATIDSTDIGTTYTFVGGKGAGATVAGTMASPPLDFNGVWAKAAGLKTVNGKIVQTKALRETMTMNATTAKAQKLPAACKALVKHLPKATKR